MNIFLIGYMGSGKTTIGKALAGQLNIEFIDLDDLIKERFKSTINEIFKNQGETSFRLVEADELRKLTSTPNKRIIAVGGGTPCFHQNMDWMLEDGLPIYLSVDSKVVHKRIGDQLEDRPILKDKSSKERIDTISSQMKARDKFYEKAPIKVKASSALEAIVKDLSLLLKRY